MKITRVTKWQKPMDAELALKLSKIVHDNCKDVPHDIGVELAEIAASHQTEQTRHPGGADCSDAAGSVANKDYDTLISLCRTIVMRYNKEHCAINPPIESLGKLLKRFKNK